MYLDLNLFILLLLLLSKIKNTPRRGIEQINYRRIITDLETKRTNNYHLRS